MYEQIRTIMRILNLEASRKCHEVPGCLKVGEKVACTLHTAVHMCVGHRDPCAAPGQALGTHCVKGGHGDYSQRCLQTEW